MIESDQYTFQYNLYFDFLHWWRKWKWFSKNDKISAINDYQMLMSLSEMAVDVTKFEFI